MNRRTVNASTCSYSVDQLNDLLIRGVLKFPLFLINWDDTTPIKISSSKDFTNLRRRTHFAEYNLTDEAVFTSHVEERTALDPLHEFCLELIATWEEHQLKFCSNDPDDAATKKEADEYRQKALLLAQGKELPVVEKKKKKKRSK